MVLSRLWYVVLAVLLGIALSLLYIAQSIQNRSGMRALGEGLQSDSQVVSWYLKNDARERSAHLIKYALGKGVAQGLAASSKSDDDVPSKARDQVREGLNKVRQTIPKEEQFDAVFAVDGAGRVVAHIGYEQAQGMEGFELGGYSAVADALHGHLRDDTWLFERMYRVVTRPVEFEFGQAPAGAIIGARLIDDRFARELSQRTGAAVAFYVNKQRIASGAPADFDKTQLDQIINDLAEVEKDEAYVEKGRSQVRDLTPTTSVVYARLPGEAWQLGAGYVVGRTRLAVPSITGIWKLADDKDKENINMLVVVLAVLGLAAIGGAASFFEHTRPLRTFKAESQRLSKGEVEELQPSKFYGPYRKIASDINDGLDKAIGKGGGTRRAADLQQVIGDLPDQPQMSAFSFPGDDSPSSPSNGAPTPPPSSPVASSPVAGGNGAGATPPPPAPSGGGRPPPRKVPPSVGEGGEKEWRGVYEQFVKLKESCGERTEGFTYEKFEATLKKNRAAIMQRHGVRRVKFSVYVKEGKAALKASPIRD